MLSVMPAFFRRILDQRLHQWEQWIDRRAPVSDHHTLNRRNLYIFPTFRGFLFIAVAVVLWLLGTNYQNNLVLAVAFFMAALFLVAIFHTYLNLRGLKLQCAGAPTVFAGEIADYVLVLQPSGKQGSNNLELFWRDAGLSAYCAYAGADEKTSFTVPVPTSERGWHNPGRLCVQSVYPLGLLRCWTWLNFSARALVYPSPHWVPEPPSTLLEGDVESEHPIRGGEDFSGITPYRPGDSLRSIAWKASARGKGMYTKQYSQNESREMWLDYMAVRAEGMESRLAGLCYWAIEYDRADENYGLNLPGTRIQPDKGDPHTHAVLRALALYGVDL